MEQQTGAYRRGREGSLDNPFAYFYVCSLHDAGSDSAFRILDVVQMRKCRFARAVMPLLQGSRYVSLLLDVQKENLASYSGLDVV
jgi:hypothetical protein